MTILKLSTIKKTELTTVVKLIKLPYDIVINRSPDRIFDSRNHLKKNSKKSQSQNAFVCTAIEDNRADNEKLSEARL